MREKSQHYSFCMADNIRILSYIVENRSGIEAEQVTDEKTSRYHVEVMSFRKNKEQRNNRDFIQ